jgi:hypothetical protein
MGMFDYVQCNYPLPGTTPELFDEYQTKCLGCEMKTVTITEDGCLVGYEEFENYTGTVEFYGSTIVASCPSGLYTRNGEDNESATFIATFVDGKLTNIEQTGYERLPALSSKEMPNIHDFESELSELEEGDSFVGKKLFLLWGGQDITEGYYVEVVYETDQELCLKGSDNHANPAIDRLQLLHRFQIGNLLFKDFDEAKARQDYREQKIKKAKEEYEKKLAEKIGV